MSDREDEDYILEQIDSIEESGQGIIKLVELLDIALEAREDTTIMHTIDRLEKISVQIEIKAAGMQLRAKLARKKLEEVNSKESADV